MALLESLCDDCAGPAIGSLWASGGDTPTAGGGLYTLPSTTTYCNLKSVTSYDLTGSYIYCSAGFGVDSAVRESAFWAMQNASVANDGVQWYESNGSLFAQYVTAGTPTTLATLTYSSATHKWLRMRESGGTCFWDTSPDGTAWTNRASVATSSVVTITALFGGMYTGRFNTGSDSIATIADVNIVPHAPAPNISTAAVQRASTW